jgi:hypothetical protein
MLHAAKWFYIAKFIDFSDTVSLTVHFSVIRQILADFLRAEEKIFSRLHSTRHSSLHHARFDVVRA